MGVNSVEKVAAVPETPGSGVSFQGGGQPGSKKQVREPYDEKFASVLASTTAVYSEALSRLSGGEPEE